MRRMVGSKTIHLAMVTIGIYNHHIDINGLTPQGLNYPFLATHLGNVIDEKH